MTKSRIPKKRLRGRDCRCRQQLSSSSRLLFAASASAIIISPRLHHHLPSYYHAASAQVITDCNICKGRTSGYIQYPGTNCAEYAQCSNGQIATLNKCQNGLIFDFAMGQCNWEWSASPCGDDPVCPTLKPTRSPTNEPTVRVPTERPTMGDDDDEEDEDVIPSPISSPSVTNQQPPPPSPKNFETITINSSSSSNNNYYNNLPPITYDHHSAVWAHLNANKITISNTLLRMAHRKHYHITENGNDIIDVDELRDYAYYDFYNGVRTMGTMGYVVPLPEGYVDDEGTRQQQLRNGATTSTIYNEGTQEEVVYKRNLFYLGTPSQTNAAAIGLINIAAYLSQALADSISHGSCDELNTQYNVNGVLPQSNSCGQYGQSYQDMKCDANVMDRGLECEVWDDMEIWGVESGGRPVMPMFCGPGDGSSTGSAEYIAGQSQIEEGVPNQNGRTDVEGCCWWGRGTIQTTGVCQYGKLNYYLGARAAAEGRPTMYPDIDFCSTPQSICSSNYPTSSSSSQSSYHATQDGQIEWITGLFRWVHDIQTYDDGNGWNYIEKLHEFVNGGLVDGLFIVSVSAIVTQGCHEAPCSGASGNNDNGGGTEMMDVGVRTSYFLQVLEALGLPVDSLRQQQ